MERGLGGLRGGGGKGEGVERWSRVGWACRSLVNTSRAETDFRRHPIMGSLLAAPLEKLENLRTHFFCLCSQDHLHVNKNPVLLIFFAALNETSRTLPSM